MSDEENKRDSQSGGLGPQKYLGPYSQKSLNDPDNPYNWENLNKNYRPNEYDQEKKQS